jgi:catabolite regulation protein CreA
MKNKIAILMVISIVLMMTLSACGAVKDVSTVDKLGKDFMTALKDGDATTSWAMLNQEVQTEIGGTAAWADYVKNASFSDWTFSNTQIKDSTGQIDGEATLGTDKYTLRLVFDKVSDAWLISGINFTKE